MVRHAQPVGERGAQVVAADIRVAEEGELGLRYGHYLRNRFTVAKLAWLLGLYDEPATIAALWKG